MKKVILVSGASSGIGKEIFHYLKEREFEVYGASRSFGDSLIDHTFKLDITDFDLCSKVVRSIVDTHKRIDALINVAGFGISGAVEDTPIEAIKRQIDVNFFGTVNLTKAVLPYMRKQNSGLIINFSSIAGVVGLPYQAFYSSSKFSIEGFSQALGLEVEKFGLHVVVIEPGDFKTGFTEKREKYTKEDSPYYPKFLNAVSKMEKDEQNGEDPKVIAELVYRILNAKILRNKYIVGPFFEKLFVFMRRFLPEGLTAYIFKLYYDL